MKPSSKAIEELRSHLQSAAKKEKYNFLDPDIVRISQQLDQLIVDHMTPSSKRL
ncbi:aspartyl-phosphate phosphatase Spo0E family protein [Brevibacillus ginsengisoli]|uniref:aspartyl-phosphate phosphatase Spo0E family protein n=1 Tax=Brevibacillus ginsengisoli TaxID=363854 RepID=UPI003CF3F1C4